MFTKNEVFHQRQSYIFTATGDVILMSYLHIWVFTTEDKDLVKWLISQQRLWSQTFVQDASRQIIKCSQSKKLLRKLT